MTIEGALLTMPVVWHEDCLLHEPGGEVWLGLREAGTELPERAAVILRALVVAGAAVVPPEPHDPAALLAVHDRALIDHLATIWADWEAGRYPADHGRDRVVPYVFPTAAMLAGLPLRRPAATHAQVGIFCYDTMTLVGPGSWAAIRAAADAARTAGRLVAAGEQAAYALCRPPGHHASRGGYGGSCYLNNAAVAAQALRDKGIGPVAVVDIDAHHGNGTQAIFYERADVFYASVHVDPGAGWFPHYLGFAAERGNGDGAGANRNVPLPPGSGDDAWLDAVGQLCAGVGAYGADAIVLSLGVDAAAADPESPLQVSADGYRAAGELIGALGPVAVIQEGGYDLESLGEYVLATLIGVQAGRGKAAAAPGAQIANPADATPAAPATGGAVTAEAAVADDRPAPPAPPGPARP
ncbi:MAG: histone deacetylase family protein [Streptosporangiaceae bacterium]